MEWRQCPPMIVEPSPIVPSPGAPSVNTVVARGLGQVVAQWGWYGPAMPGAFTVKVSRTWGQGGGQRGGWWSVRWGGGRGWMQRRRHAIKVGAGWTAECGLGKMGA